MESLVLEISLHWVAVALYIVGLVLFTYATLFEHPDKIRWGMWAAVAGWVPHSAALLIRWISVGHGPYMLKYEVLSSDAWVAVVMMLLFVWRRPNWAPMALVVLPVSILLMGFAVFSNPAAKALPPSFHSMWLVFHVTFNKLAMGAFILSFAAAVTLLRKLKGASGRLLDRLPGPDGMEAYTVRLVGFGFVFWSTTIIAGAIWANQSWGRYWGWDPIEVWSLVTWLCYGLLLHSRLFFHFTPRATAWSTTGCFAMSIMTVLVLPFLIPSLHSTYFQ